MRKVPDGSGLAELVWAGHTADMEFARLGVRREDDVGVGDLVGEPPEEAGRSRGVFVLICALDRCDEIRAATTRDVTNRWPTDRGYASSNKLARESPALASAKQPYGRSVRVTHVGHVANPRGPWSDLSPSRASGAERPPPRIAFLGGRSTAPAPADADRRALPRVDSRRAITGVSLTRRRADQADRPRGGCERPRTRLASTAIVTAKQRVVLAALRDAQHECDGDAASAGRVADFCPAPWHGRPDLVTAALVLLERDGMVLAAAGSTGA